MHNPSGGLIQGNCCWLVGSVVDCDGMTAKAVHVHVVRGVGCVEIVVGVND